MYVRDGYKMTELGEIPLMWEIKSLSSICDVRDGTHDSPQYVDMGIPLITSKNLKRGRIDLSEINYISEEDHKKISQRSAVDNGDIIFAMIGTIGNPVIISKQFEFSIKNVALVKFPQKGISNVFIHAFLGSKIARKQFAENMDGGVQKFLSLSSIRNLQVPLPDFPEQQKIADILSTVDEHISETESLIEKTKLLKQGMMQRLLAKGIGYTEFKDTEIGRIPVEWELSYLTDLIIDGSSITYGVVKPGDEGEVRFIRSTDVKNGAINSSNLRTITKSVSDSYKRTVLRGGELLISLVGNPGQAAVVLPEFAGANIARQVALLRIDENKCNIFFAYYYLQSEAGQIELKDRIIGTAQQVINLKDLKTVLVAVPPLEEQQRITFMLTAIDDQIDSCQTKFTALTNLKSALMQQLLTGKTRVKI